MDGCTCQQTENKILLIVCACVLKMCECECECGSVCVVRQMKINQQTSKNSLLIDDSVMPSTVCSCLLAGRCGIQHTASIAQRRLSCHSFIHSFVLLIYHLGGNLLI